MRALARGAVERLLAPLAGAARRRRAQSGDACILSYHNVTPDGVEPTGDTSLHLPRRAFIDQIDRLRRTHEVVSLAALTEAAPPPAASVGRRPRAAVTFDDAYRGALRIALPELVERRVPATVFVAPGLLGARAFWWDALAATDGGGLDATVRRRALEDERGRPAPVESPGPLRPDQGPGDLPSLREAARLPGITLGSHTWAHPNLTALDEPELEEELVRPRDWLRATFPEVELADHLAFPYGLWDRRVADAAYAAGYRFLYRVEGGVARGGAVPDAPIARINVPAGVSGRGFELRVAGLIGSPRASTA